MKNDKLGFLDYLLLIFLLGLMVISTSCTKEDILISEPSLEMDARLPIDNNGYYHLQLNPNTNQTIHRVDGMVTSIFEPTKVSFSSNLHWIFQGERVPTSNFSSWATPDDPSISNVIAPIYSMRTDTLSLIIRVNEWDIIQTLNIVLD
jgi:hypothetical protein